MSSGFNIYISGSKVPITYGAIMNNSTSDVTVSTLNIYTSISNLSDAYVPKVDSHNDVDDYFIVMPGYKLIVYLDVNGGSSYTMDNTNGVAPSFKKSSEVAPKINEVPQINAASSVRLYYKDDNNELTELT